MEKFCKLFETDKYGQILIKLDQAAVGLGLGAELRIFAQPPGFGACSIATFYGNDDEDWDRAQQALDDMTQSKAEAVAAAIFASCSEVGEQA
jgi:hypothetical protein